MLLHFERLSSLKEVQRERNGTDKMPILMYEEMIWNPELSGIQNYLTQVICVCPLDET